MKITRPGFFPVPDVRGKPNAKPYFVVAPDGSVTERVFLDIPDMRAREELICLHYLKHRVRIFLRQDVGIRIISRDDPWDFAVELSTGDRFNLEITSIADSQHHFEIQKREERLALYLQRDRLTLRELRHLARWFNMPEVEDVIRKEEATGTGPDDPVANPLDAQKPRVFMSWMDRSSQPLAKQIEASVRAKLAKSHEEKENTVLIIDNRTSSFDIPDYLEAAESLSPFLDEIPFPEVWFYTGYYSDELGDDAEFSFAPLRVTPEQNEVLAEMAATGRIDEHGRIVA